MDNQQQPNPHPQPQPSDRIMRTPEQFQQAIINSLYYARGSNIQSASHYDGYMALSRTVRDHLIDRWRKTVDMRYATNPKFVYYLSAEYLLGRQLTQNLLYTDTTELAEEALDDTNMPLEDLIAMMWSRAWATAAWAGWRPASSTRWPRSTFPPSAMASATNSASSSSRSRMAGRSRGPTSGCSMATRGSFPSPTTW